ncbi:NAD-dependent succinate-semialdehyde dehydrogenase [Rhodococcus sp. NPDC057529]|uniref:NAD-dependent succinate-semialdehyde dehydrogenase n=1 Tax=Rhodococcus sp. NPDC057529 TaxID=3346158 RepID=UPI00366FBD97
MTYELTPKLFIDGAWEPAVDGSTFTVENPATGEPIATVANAGIDDGRRAAAAAAAAGPDWAARTPRHRAEILRAVFDRMIAAKDQIADLIVAENGKARTDALAEVDYAAEFFRWYSEEAVRLPGYLTQSPTSERRIIELSQPVGVALLLTPWNLPAAMITRKIAPALAAGCTVVVKPSPQTPLTALLLAQILHDAGVPTGVVNIIPTSRDIEVVADLIDHGPVRAVSFTGSTRVGSALLAQASRRILNTSMELGGNAPFLVFPDADIDAAVAGALQAKMRHNAEACTAANRFYVHDTVRTEFVDKLAAAFNALRVGPGTEPGVQVGPMASAAAKESIENAVQIALDGGGKPVTGNTPHPGPGYFFTPTLIDNIAPDADILGHELFGPVAPVVEFTDTDDVIAWANSTDMGLGSYIFTGTLQHGLRVAEQLDTGMVGLNTGIFSDPAAPFGGTKQSGIGREGGRHGITEFLETKYIATTW